MNKIIYNKFGYIFPPAMRSAGYIIIFLGFFIASSIFNNSSILSIFIIFIFSIIIIFLGLTFSFTEEGIQIDIESKLFRKYYTLYFIKLGGKWQSYEKYPFIAIRNMKFSTTAYSRANVPCETSLDTFYDIFLLDETHSMKVLIKRLSNKEKAIEEANIIEKQLNVQLITYNPVISPKTQARRKR